MCTQHLSIVLALFVVARLCNTKENIYIYIYVKEKQHRDIKRTRHREDTQSASFFCCCCCFCKWTMEIRLPR